MTEILAPAGSEEAFRAAIQAGADAIYLGGTCFGARAYAANFEENTLLHSLDLAHLFNKRVYLTVNTLIKEEELDSLYTFLLPYYKAGLDAVIVQDLGAVRMIRDNFKGMKIHASTQMTVTGQEGAAFLKEYGVDRVVPARELSLEEIRAIRERSDIEIECFVHGALCYCYSGQCLMSSLTGGRSGNRGRCAQPCRLPFTVLQNGKKISDTPSAYALNTKDICTLDLIPELIAAGIDSFKIEGRMKRPEYVAGVTSVYRKYRDLAKEGKNYKVDKRDRALLADLFNREGFSSSYYKQHNGQSMMALHNKKRTAKENDRTEKAYTFVREQFLSTEPKIELTGSFIATNKQAELTIFANGETIRTKSTQVFPAKTKSLTKEEVIKQLQKTGGTPYTIRLETVELAQDLFMPVAAMNDLRRNALADFEMQLRARHANKEPEQTGHKKDTIICYPNNSNQRSEKNCLSVYVSTKEQFCAATEIEEVEEIYVPAYLATQLFKEKLPQNGYYKKQLSLALPAPLRQNGVDLFKGMIDKAVQAGWGFLAGSMEDTAYYLSKGLSGRIRLGAGVYMMNSESMAFMKEFGITKDTIPYELNRYEIKKRDNSHSELIVYGRIPLMISAQCLKKNYETCTKDYPKLTLSDRKNYRYPVFADCSVCQNTIYNSFPISLLSKKKEIKELGVGSFRFFFTDETAETVQNLIRAWTSKKPFTEDFEFTRGHFGRGIE